MTCLSGALLYTQGMEKSRGTGDGARVTGGWADGGTGWYGDAGCSTCRVRAVDGALDPFVLGREVGWGLKSETGLLTLIPDLCGALSNMPEVYTDGQIDRQYCTVQMPRYRAARYKYPAWPTFIGKG